MFILIASLVGSARGHTSLVTQRSATAQQQHRTTGFRLSIQLSTVPYHSLKVNDRLVDRDLGIAFLPTIHHITRPGAHNYLEQYTRSSWVTCHSSLLPHEAVHGNANPSVPRHAAGRLRLSSTCSFPSFLDTHHFQILLSPPSTSPTSPTLLPTTTNSSNNPNSLARLTFVAPLSSSVVPLGASLQTPPLDILQSSQR